MRKQEIISWLCIAVIFGLLIIFSFSSCNVQKHFRETTKMVDSTVLKSYYDSVRMLKSENSHLQSEINELTYSGVIFGYSRTDTGSTSIPIRSATVDTLDNSWSPLTKPKTNHVYISSNGDIKASGNILAAYVSKSFMQKIIADKDTKIDSLSKALQNETSSVKKEDKKKDETKIVKTPFPWLWLVVMLIAGCYLEKFVIRKVPFLNQII